MMIFTLFLLSTQGSIVFTCQVSSTSPALTVHCFRDYRTDFFTRRSAIVRIRVRFSVCLGPDHVAAGWMGDTSSSTVHECTACLR